MSDQNENIVQNADAKPNVNSAQISTETVKQSPSKFAQLFKAVTTPTPRITDIDWSKNKVSNKNAWENLDSKLKKDWVIWHEAKVQNTFATLAVLLEIISVITIIFDNGLRGWNNSPAADSLHRRYNNYCCIQKNFVPCIKSTTSKLNSCRTRNICFLYAIPSARG